MERKFTEMPVELVETEQQYVERLEGEYARLLEQLTWTHTLLSILIEEEGGVVTISKNTLESYDFHGSSLNVYEDVESQNYIIEVTELEQ